MDVVKLIEDARQAGVVIELVDGDLVIEAKAKLRGWVSKLRPHKAEIVRLLQGDEPEPDPPAPAAEPYQDFPVDALPGPVRGLVVAGSKAIGCDPSFVALPLLTALGAAIGNTRRLRVKRGWVVPPILWAAIVGESGSAKTPAFRLALRAIRERQRKAMAAHAEAAANYQEDILHYEKAMADWKRDKKTLDPPPEKPEEPHAERCVVSDTTVEALAPVLLDNPRGLLLARDELAGWVTSFDRYAVGGRGADSAHWLSMHGGESALVDRKTGPMRMLFVPRASVCVCGGIQPGILARVMNAENRESGLLARLLLACPPRRAKRWTEAEVDPDAEARVAELFEWLFSLLPDADPDGAPCPKVIDLDAGAKAAFVAHYNHHAAETADLDGDLAAAWSKLEETPARLALILHLTRWAAGEPVDPDLVDDGTMHAAVGLGRWFCREARRVYDLLNETSLDRERRHLLQWIERRGGVVTSRDVQQGHREYRTALAAESALVDLVKGGYGTWVTDTHQGGRGRPVRRFRLSTVSTEYTNGKNNGEKPICVSVDSVDEAEIDLNDLLAEAAEADLEVAR